MERIAIISDIHGNIPALDAVMEDIQRRDIKRIICLGDIVGKGPHPEVAVDLVRNHCEEVVKGNWDDGITKPHDNQDIIWHQERLGEERMNYLRNLPFSVDFFMGGKLVRLFHASPESVYKRIQPWDPIEVRKSMFNDTENTGRAGREPDIVGYGDIHNAYIQNFEGKTLFNAGSVGNPLEITQASYAVIEGNYGSAEPGPVSIQLVRVPYDIELSVRHAVDANMPQLEPYIKELRTARYRGLG